MFGLLRDVIVKFQPEGLELLLLLLNLTYLEVVGLGQFVGVVGSLTGPQVGPVLAHDVVDGVAGAHAPPAARVESQRHLHVRQRLFVRIVLRVLRQLLEYRRDILCE